MKYCENSENLKKFNSKCKNSLRKIFATIEKIFWNPS